MRILSFIITILYSVVSFGQKDPFVYKEFWNKHDMFSSEHLVLSSDSLFFYSRSCECGEESYGKGKWKIKGDILFLSGFDSTTSYPNANITSLNNETSDSIHIVVYDYFNKPIKDMTLGLIYNDTTNFNTTIKFLETTGKLSVSKKEFCGVFLIYETKSQNTLTKNKNPFYTFEKETTDIVINIDFASAAFDRKPIPLNFSNQKLKIKGGNLYDQQNRLAYISKIQ